MSEYKRLYRELFDLTMAGPNAETLPSGEIVVRAEAARRDLERRLDALPGSRDQKQQMSQDIGWRLYAARVYKDRVLG